MLGTWRWNAGFGLFGTVLTILFSFGNNPWSVVLLRGIYAFIAFFVVAYGMRAVLAFILRPPAIVGEPPAEDTAKGAALDLVTPEDRDDLNDLLKSRLNGEETGGAEGNGPAGQAEAVPFRPLTPPKLVSAQDKGPDELAKAIRHLTGE